MPSELNRVFWRYTLADIRFKLTNKLGEQQAILSQHFEALCNTASLALGGSDSNSDSRPVVDVKDVPKTAAEMTSKFNAIFG